MIVAVGLFLVAFTVSLLMAPKPPRRPPPNDLARPSEPPQIPRSKLEEDAIRKAQKDARR